MTTMDSDSVSQDSDDGRRFRFEATRKDSAALVDDAMRKTRSPKKKSKHKSSRYESRHYHRERRERPKHESDRKGDDKDPKHYTKSRNSRQEDSKNHSSKDHRDAFIGFTLNDRGFRNSSGGDEKEKLRDSKRQSDRDRSVHLAQRPRERSYERNHHEEQTSSDKHRSRYHERHGHRSRDRSRQSSRVKSSNGDHRSREDHERHDSSRKTSMKEDRSQNSKDYSSPKNIERERSHSEARSCENTKKDPLVNAQDCKDLDLSQFNVLSEIDENTSDDRNYESRAPSPREGKLYDSRNWSESCATNEARENGEDANTSEEEWRKELSKVKKRNYDPVSSSRSNPNAISDSSLGSTPSATIFLTRDTFTSSKKEQFEKTITCDDTSEFSGLGEKKYSNDSFSKETRLEKDAEQTESMYGPLLPPRFVSSDNDSEKTSPRTLDENKISNEVVDESHKSECFIGPRRPSGLSDCQNEEQEEAKKDADSFAMEVDTVFGPVLPPHLLQRQRDNDSRDKIIGPVLPDAVKLCRESSIALSESDEDCAIGPLPVDHPALRNSRVHEKLDLRAQKIRNEGHLGEIDIESKREEWMTELPSVQAANLGLGPRKFRIREGPDMSDRSCWTDTPAQKAQKQKDLEMKKLNNASEPDKEEFYKKDTGKSKKREKSLLEMHQSKIAKKKRKKEKEAERTGISTRRPFDRDIDLQVTRLDQAQKKTVLMKAQLLDDRFSRGQI